MSDKARMESMTRTMGLLSDELSQLRAAVSAQEAAETETSRVAASRSPSSVVVVAAVREKAAAAKAIVANAGRAAVDAARNRADGVDDAVRGSPWVFMGVAAVVGLALGVFVSRGD